MSEKVIVTNKGLIRAEFNFYVGQYLDKFYDNLIGKYLDYHIYNLEKLYFINLFYINKYHNHYIITSYSELVDLSEAWLFDIQE